MTNRDHVMRVPLAVGPWPDEVLVGKQLRLRAVHVRRGFAGLVLEDEDGGKHVLQLPMFAVAAILSSNPREETDGAGRSEGSV